VQRSWLSRFFGQFLVLLRKNWLLSIRNVSALTLQLLTPFLALCLVLLIDASLRADASSQRRFMNELDPDAEGITPIPDCLDDMFITDESCMVFLYAPNDGTHSKAVAESMATRNKDYPGGKEIPLDKIKGFPNASAIDDWMFDNPEMTLGAVIFNEQLDGEGNLMRMDFELQFNSTPKFFKGSFQDPNMFFAMPFQMAAEREIHRHFKSEKGIAADNLNWAFAYKPFAHPALSTASFVATFASSFIFAASMFNFVLTIGSLVGEREGRLRQALRTMGMLDSSYWCSWGFFHVLLAFVLAMVTCVSGYALQFDIFKINGFGLLLVFLFMFLMAMNSFAYMVSVFIKKSTTATSIGFALFVVGWIMQSVVQTFPYTTEFRDTHGGFWFVFFALFPWCLLGKGLGDLGQASATAQSLGISFGDRSSYCINWEQDRPPGSSASPPTTTDRYVNYSCVLSIGTIINIYALEYVLYFVVAVYLDNILKNENGVARRPWYFLLPSYWHASEKGTSVQIGNAGGRGPPLDGPAQPDSDVKEEESNMLALFKERTGIDPSNSKAGRVKVNNKPSTALALEVYGLRRWFGSFQAIKNSWFSVEEGSLFCLLGPNGAGKSTTINCLTGIIPASGGDALVYDESLTAPGGMDRIRSYMGVCPQFDVLWDELTGREHLEIYGQVKGLTAEQSRREAQELLHSVKLEDSASVTAGSYSGGMKRRLSVAIALLGNPKVVYLDEPTTGMDPINRRHVWDIIEAAKKGRAIILTTHSMEEADILGDRIAIMARGSLRCIGSSLRLKNKFGAGYCISVNVSPPKASASAVNLAAGRAAKVKDFFETNLGLEPSDETKAYVQFLVPKSKEKDLPDFLKLLKENSEELGVTDLHVALTSLEEVFLSIARQAEMESNSNKVDKVELKDGSFLSVPLGVEQIVDPATGIQYNVKWAQDESGNLQILYAHPSEPVSQ